MMKGVSRGFSNDGDGGKIICMLEIIGWSRKRKKKHCKDLYRMISVNN